MSALNGTSTVSRGKDDENIRDRTEQPVRSVKSQENLSSWGYAEHGLGTDRATAVASN